MYGGTYTSLSCILDDHRPRAAAPKIESNVKVNEGTWPSQMCDDSRVRWTLQKTLNRQNRRSVANELWGDLLDYSILIWLDRLGSLAVGSLNLLCEIYIWRKIYALLRAFLNSCFTRDSSKCWNLHFSTKFAANWVLGIYGIVFLFIVLLLGKLIDSLIFLCLKSH